MMVKSNMAKMVGKLGKTDVSDYDIYKTVVDNMDNPHDLSQYRAGSTDFKPYGEELANNFNVYSDYLNTLAIQYGMIFQRAFMAKNPLAQYFKRGQMPYGGVAESIIYDTISMKTYHPFYRDRKGATRSPFEQNLINPKARSYNTYQDIVGEVTFIDTLDTQVVQNLSQFHDQIYAKLSALVNSAILDEYKMTKLAITEPVVANQMPVYNVKVPSVEDRSKETTEHLVKVMLETVTNFSYFSNDYNGSGITQASKVDDIVVIVPTKRAVDINADYYAQIFNPEAVSASNIIEAPIDRFPDVWKYTKDHVVTQDDADKRYVDVIDNSEYKNPYGRYYIGETIPKGAIARAGATDAQLYLRGDMIACIILDRDALQLWDALPITLSSVSAPNTRSTNVFLSKKTLMMFINALNAIAITTTPADEGFHKFDITNAGNGTGSDTGSGSNGSTGNGSASN